MMPHRTTPEIKEKTDRPHFRYGLRRWMLQFTLLLFFVGFLVTGLLWLGKHAREQLREHERFQVKVAEIECIPQPPIDLSEFLYEVQYHGGLAERVSTLEKGLP